MTEKNRSSNAVRMGFITYPMGRYEKYEHRVRKVSETLAFIGKHKAVLICAAALLTATMLTFLFCIGIFIGDVTCKDFAYGDTPALSADAFLTDVHYQYASVADATVWRDSMPAEPGEYLIRAVSQNPFGMKRYSDAAAFVLKPRRLTVSMKEASCVYGELTDVFLRDQISAIGLAEGDRICDIQFRCTSERWEEVHVSVASFCVINADGIDVTAAYQAQTEDTVLPILPREITVSTVGGEKVYDGLPWTDASGTLTEGSLAGGDRIALSFPTFSAQVGSYTVTANAYSITDKNGTDVTARYRITFAHGVLTVSPRRLVFSTESAEKVYDGTPLSHSGWTLLEGSAADGHSLDAKAIGSLVSVGECANELSVTVSDADAADVSANYDIIVRAGRLKVTPIMLRFTTDSAEKVYDGKGLTADGYIHIEGNLLPSHRMTCSTSGIQTEVGVSNNTLDIAIYNEKGENITKDGYTIEVDYGTLRVTPRPLTVTSGSAQKVYDGTPLSCTDWKITDGSLGSCSIALNFSGSQTEVGESPNTFWVNIGLGDADVTENFDITYVYGTLSVLPGEKGEQGESGDAPSLSPDGETTINFPNLSDPITYARIKLTGDDAYADRIYLRIGSYGDYTGSGFKKGNAYSDFIYQWGDYVSPLDLIGRRAEAVGMPVSILEIERLNGCPVLIPYYSYSTQKYFERSDIYFESSLTSYDYLFYQIPDLATVMTLEGAYFDFTNEKAYTDYVYSEYLQIPESTEKELLRIAKENGLGSTSDTQTQLILDIQSFIQNAADYNLYAKPYPQGVDVAVYFLDVAKEGICQQYAAAATMMYRAFGIPARYVTGFVKETSPNARIDVTSHDAHAWVEIYLDWIGWVPVEVTGSGSVILPPVDRRQALTVCAYSASKEYDGMPFGVWSGDKFSITHGQLLPGHTISVSISEKGRYATFPGTYKCEITKVVIFDENGKDVTDECYSLMLKDGEMTIEKRRLTIRLTPADECFDGTPLGDDEWRIVSGNLLPTDYLTVRLFSEALAAPDEHFVETITVSVYQRSPSGKPVGIDSCYDITILHDLPMK